MNAHRLAIVVVLLLLPTLSSAQDSGAQPAGASAQDEAARLIVPWSGESGRGVALGMEEGAWTSGFAVGLRARIPFTPFFGLTLRASVVTALPGGLPTVAGGGIELWGAGPVILNVIRLYGGGDAAAYYPVSGPNRAISFGGGGHFGFEFFVNQRTSFYIEIGGRSPIVAGGPGGATVMTGMNLYPFST